MRPSQSSSTDKTGDRTDQSFTPTGFPSPAEDHVEATLDLHDLLIQHPAATFFLQMDGDAMCGVGILDQDVLIVDRSLSPTLNTIVVAVVNGEFLVRRYVRQKGSTIILVAHHPDFPPIHIFGDMTCEVWGVVTAAIHRVQP